MAMPEEEIRRIERVRIAASPIVPAAIDVARVSWGGVWSGFCVGLGILVLLGALGMVVGTTMVGPGLADPQAFGPRAGLWTVASAATRAEPFVRMASWAVFAGLVVSLIAALLGGTAGARPFPLRVPV